MQQSRIPLAGTPGRPIADEALTVPVPLAQNGYTIHVGAGLLARLGELYPPSPGARAAVISAHTVADLYGQTCLEALRGAGWAVELLVVPDGEEAKTLTQAGELYEQCARLGLDRGATLFALGGGVVGDLTGFVAGTYMRGIDFVQIPTTLLAQVDASVGGKTAVDLPAGKNLVGVFHQPRLVAIDVSTLKTLPRRDLSAGMAEVIKHAAVADREMFDHLAGAAAQILAADGISLRQLVARNCQIKAEVVVADPHEHGVRAWLNYGHTIGHAIEVAAGEWELRHGEAVAWGMVAEACAAVKAGLADREVPAALRTLLEKYGLACQRPVLDPARARQAIWHDKKIVNGRLKLPLVPRIGECLIREDVPVAVLVETMEEVFFT